MSIQALLLVHSGAKETDLRIVLVLYALLEPIAVSRSVVEVGGTSMRHCQEFHSSVNAASYDHPAVTPFDAMKSPRTLRVIWKYDDDDDDDAQSPTCANIGWFVEHASPVIIS